MKDYVIGNDLIQQAKGKIGSVLPFHSYTDSESYRVPLRRS